MKEKRLLTSCGVQVTLSPAYGRILTSLSPVQAGAVVFTELPILISLTSLTNEEENLVERESTATGLNLIEDFLFVKSFCVASDFDQASVLDCYSPSPVDVGKSGLLTVILAVVPLCQMFSWASGMTAEVLEKVVLVKACNAHGFYGQGSGSAALYAIGSKMRHSCSPNVVYTSQRTKGVGTFIAKTNIEAGDELFISYIDHIRSTPMRQTLLIENYLFECKCDFCTTGTDRFRGINCRCGGTLFRKQSERLWNCDACRIRLSDDEKPISDSEEAFIVKEAQKFLSSFQVESRSQSSSLVEKLTARLGPKHAITKLAEKSFLENHLLVSYPVVERHMDAIIHLTDSILDWCEHSPDFLDSTLIEIGCAVGRCGHFDKALTYLAIVHADMQFMFGDCAETNDTMNLVTRAIHACRSRNSLAVPDLIGRTNLS